MNGRLELNKETLNKMDKVRRTLKAQDDRDLDLDDAFFDQLHDKIMAKVEETTIVEPPFFEKPGRMLRAHWRSWLYPTVGLMSILIVGSFLSPVLMEFERSLQRSGLWSDGEQRIAAEAVSTLQDLPQTFIVSQSEADFFMDVASNSIENLSVDKLKKALGKKKN